MNSKQMGKFDVPTNRVRLVPEEVANLFAAMRLVPVRCESMFDRDAFEYIAISEKFRELSENERAPRYKIKEIVTEDGLQVEVEECGY